MIVWFSDFVFLRMYQHGSLVNNIPQIYLVDGKGFRPIQHECKYSVCGLYFSGMLFFFVFVCRSREAPDMLEVTYRNLTEEHTKELTYSIV